MVRLEFENFLIDVVDEVTYKPQSSDNVFNYNKCYFSENTAEHQSIKYGVRICQDETIVSSCILIASGGYSGIHQHSAVIDNRQFLICVGDTIFCLSLPDLALKWEVNADLVTCFQIFRLREDYIIHGETLITRIDKNGIIKWEFGGADIFVSIDDQEEISIEEDCILLTDFDKRKYRIDFDGNLLA